MKDSARVEIDANAVGRGTISIDGQDVSDIVQAVTLHLGQNQPSTVIVQFVPMACRVRVEGIVMEQATPVGSLEDVIANLDPKEIDDAALARMGWDADPEAADKTLTENILDIIREKVSHAH